MGKVKGADKLIALMRKKHARVNSDATKQIEVGYSASHAIHVHENLEVHHDSGQAKFLEQPLRQMRSRLQREILQDTKRGVPLGEALRRAGEKLLRVSQKLVPVDTGELRSSGYVRINRKRG